MQVNWFSLKFLFSTFDMLTIQMQTSWQNQNISLCAQNNQHKKYIWRPSQSHDEFSIHPNSVWKCYTIRHLKWDSSKKWSSRNTQNNNNIIEKVYSDPHVYEKEMMHHKKYIRMSGWWHILFKYNTKSKCNRHLL